jgi:hypothetical protein
VPYGAILHAPLSCRSPRKQVPGQSSEARLKSKPDESGFTCLFQSEVAHDCLEFLAGFAVEPEPLFNGSLASGYRSERCIECVDELYGRSGEICWRPGFIRFHDREPSTKRKGECFLSQDQWDANGKRTSSS